MMNKKRSSRIELSKYAFLLPVFLLTGAAFTVSKAEGSIEGVVEKANETPVIKLDNDLQVDVSLPVKMVSTLNKPIKENLPTSQMTTDTLKSKAVVDTIHFRANVAPGAEPLYIVEGKEVNSTIMSAIPAAEIESIDVIKDNGKTIYGEKGKNGVVIVALKKNDSPNMMNQALTFTYDKNEDGATASKTKKKGQLSEVVVTGYKSKDASESKLKGGVQGIAINVTGRATDREPGKFGARSIGGIKGDPLFVVDGKTIVDKKINELDPNTIDNITILKDKKATALYGDQAKNGVVIITTKTYAKEHPEAVPSEVTDRLSGKVKMVIKGELDKEKGEVAKEK